MRRLFAACVLLVTMFACGSNFSPKNEVQGIRILAAKADLPYAHPGDTVNLEVLADDGRRAPNLKPMRVFWAPVPCINPPGDQYYLCYPFFEAAFPKLHQDITSAFVENTKLTIQIPSNALDAVQLQPGQTERYTTAYNFIVACAGHIERVELQSDLGINQTPIGCFDDQTGAQLNSTDFVFGFTRVYVFDQRRNTIPSFTSLLFQGQPIDFTKGITTGHCVKDKKTGNCQTVRFDVTFDDAVAELDPDNVDSNGHEGRETIYVDWFTTQGKFSDDREILYDGNLGRPPKTYDEYSPPTTAPNGTMWAILHDNRGGTTWQAFPFVIQ